MSEHQSCDHCKFRGKYDANPKSFLGKMWRWHAGWCPGWKKYMTSLSPEERRKLAEQYKMPKYL